MGDETISYQFEIAEDDWRHWTQTVPRDVALDTRLKTLLRQDAKAARSNGEVEQASVNVMVSRIRIRAMQALGALRDDGDTETAIEQLDEIQDIADALES